MVFTFQNPKSCNNIITLSSLNSHITFYIYSAFTFFYLDNAEDLLSCNLQAFLICRDKGGCGKSKKQKHHSSEKKNMTQKLELDSFKEKRRNLN